MRDPRPSDGAPPASVEPRPAHPLRRLVAYGVDGLVLAGLILVVLWASNMLLGPTVRFDNEAGTLTIDQGRTLVAAIIAFAIAGLYHVGSWSRSGRTPAQALFGMRVVRLDGRSTPTARQAAVRWLALGAPVALLSPVVRGSAVAVMALTIISVLWSAVLLLTTVFDRRHRGLHDRLAGTIVVRARGGPPAR